MKTGLNKIIDKLADLTKRILKTTQEHQNVNDLHAVALGLIKNAYKQGFVDSITKERKVYCIDEPNFPYEIIREASDGYFYAVLFHPSHYDMKVLTESKKGKTWFDTKEECLNARIKKLERDLELEKSSRERKLQ